MDKLYTLIGGPLDGLKLDLLHYNQLVNYYDKETDSYKTVIYIKELVKMEQEKK